jgi:hypothetical protein
MSCSKNAVTRIISSNLLSKHVCVTSWYCITNFAGFNYCNILCKAICRVRWTLTKLINKPEEFAITVDNLLRNVAICSPQINCNCAFSMLYNNLISLLHDLNMKNSRVDLANKLDSCLMKLKVTCPTFASQCSHPSSMLASHITLRNHFSFYFIGDSNFKHISAHNNEKKFKSGAKLNYLQMELATISCNKEHLVIVTNIGINHRYDNLDFGCCKDMILRLLHSIKSPFILLHFEIPLFVCTRNQHNLATLNNLNLIFQTTPGCVQIRLPLDVTHFHDIHYNYKGIDIVNKVCDNLLLNFQ